MTSLAVPTTPPWVGSSSLAMSGQIGMILSTLTMALTLLSIGCSDEAERYENTVEQTPLGPPGPGEDGAACEISSDCFGGTCLSEFENNLPGGYCTSYDCTLDSCNGGVCVVAKWGNTACIDDCLVQSDCRDGENRIW